MIYMRSVLLVLCMRSVRIIHPHKHCWGASNRAGLGRRARGRVSDRAGWAGVRVGGQVGVRVVSDRALRTRANMTSPAHASSSVLGCVYDDRFRVIRERYKRVYSGIYPHNHISHSDTHSIVIYSIPDLGIVREPPCKHDSTGWAVPFRRRRCHLVLEHLLG